VYPLYPLDYPVKTFMEERWKTRKAGVVVVPVRFGATCSGEPGTAFGPDAIIAASEQLEHYDNEMRVTTTKKVPIATHAGIRASNDQAKVIKELTTLSTNLLRDGKFIFGLGGEHSITEIFVRACLSLARRPFTVLQFDAHSDWYNEYDGNKRSHACVGKRISDLGTPLVQVGVRSTTEDIEKARIKKGVRVFPAHELKSNWSKLTPVKIARAIKTEYVYVTIDVDCLDIPYIGSCTGLPEPGGPSWDHIVMILRAVAQYKKIIGADMVEFRPSGDATFAYAFAMAKMMYKLLTYRYYFAKK